MKKTWFFHEAAFDFPDERAVILAACPEVRPAQIVSGDLLQMMHSSRQFIPVLPRKTVWHLFRKYNCLRYLDYMGEDQKKGFLEVRDILAWHNLRLCYYVIKRFFLPKTKAVCVPEDLFFSSYMHLLHVIESFDYRRGFAFSTFARPSLQHFVFTSWREEIRRDRRFQSGKELQDIVDHRRNPHDIDQIEEEINELQAYIIREVPAGRIRSILQLRLGLVDGKLWNYGQLAKRFRCSAFVVRYEFNRVMKRLFGQTVQRRDLFRSRTDPS